MNEHMPDTQQFFRDLFSEERDTPIQEAVDMVLQFASGEADALSGCYLSVDHDLAALTEKFGTRARTDELTLRLVP